MCLCQSGLAPPPPLVISHLRHGVWSEGGPQTRPGRGAERQRRQHEEALRGGEGAGVGEDGAQVGLQQGEAEPRGRDHLHVDGQGEREGQREGQ